MRFLVVLSGLAALATVRAADAPNDWVEAGQARSIRPSQEITLTLCAASPSTGLPRALPSLSSVRVRSHGL